MDNDHLKILKEKGLQEYDSIGDLLLFAKSFFKMDFQSTGVPVVKMVAGNKSFKRVHWETYCLEPDAFDDRLTINRFLDGLQVLDNAVKKDPHLDSSLKGSVLYRGPNHIGDSCPHFMFITVCSPETTYSLELNKPYKECVYTAHNKLSSTKLQNLVRAYTGPK